jgi:hypothetical protein
VTLSAWSNSPVVLRAQEDPNMVRHSLEGDHIEAKAAVDIIALYYLTLAMCVALIIHISSKMGINFFNICQELWSRQTTLRSMTHRSSICAFLAVGLVANIHPAIRSPVGLTIVGVFGLLYGPRHPRNNGKFKSSHIWRLFLVCNANHQPDQTVIIQPRI